MDAQTSIAVHPSYRKAGRPATQAGGNVVMSHKAVAVAALIAVFSVAAGVQPAAPTAPTVTIDSGKLAANEKDGMMSFLGIPYASPPTGDLRWRAPQPVKTWQGTRQTSRPSHGPQDTLPLTLKLARLATSTPGLPVPSPRLPTHHRCVRGCSMWELRLEQSRWTAGECKVVVDLSVPSGYPFNVTLLMTELPFHSLRTPLLPAHFFPAPITYLPTTTCSSLMLPVQHTSSAQKPSLR
jgi:hypothetical protein